MNNINLFIDKVVSTKDDSYMTYLSLIEKDFNKRNYVLILDKILDYLYQLKKYTIMDLNCEKDYHIKLQINKTIINIDKKINKIKLLYINKQDELKDMKR